MMLIIIIITVVNSSISFTIMTITAARQPALTESIIITIQVKFNSRVCHQQRLLDFP